MYKIINEIITKEHVLIKQTHIMAFSLIFMVRYYHLHRSSEEIFAFLDLEKKKFSISHH